MARPKHKRLGRIVILLSFSCLVVLTLGAQDSTPVDVVAALPYNGRSNQDVVDLVNPHGASGKQFVHIYDFELQRWVTFWPPGHTPPHTMTMATRHDIPVGLNTSSHPMEVFPQEGLREPQMGPAIPVPLFGSNAKVTPLEWISIPNVASSSPALYHAEGPKGKAIWLVVFGNLPIDPSNEPVADLWMVMSRCKSVVVNNGRRLVFADMGDMEENPSTCVIHLDSRTWNCGEGSGTQDTSAEPQQVLVVGENMDWMGKDGSAIRFLVGDIVWSMRQRNGDVFFHRHGSSLLPAVDYPLQLPGTGTVEGCPPEGEEDPLALGIPSLPHQVRLQEGRRKLHWAVLTTALIALALIFTLGTTVRKALFLALPFSFPALLRKLRKSSTDFVLPHTVVPRKGNAFLQSPTVSPGLHPSTPQSARGTPPTSFSSFSLSSEDGVRWTVSGRVLGSGAYGIVKQGLDRLTGQIVAVKELSVTKAEEVEKEVSLLAGLEHPNIVSYLGSYTRGATVHLVMEYVPCGSLESLMQTYRHIALPALRMYATDILNGLHYLHTNGIIHRDIKPANILIGQDGQCKLADFGISRTQCGDVSIYRSMNAGDLAKTVPMGTPAYMSAEAIQGTPCEASDVWAMGLTLLELASGQKPWHHLRATQPLALLIAIVRDSEKGYVLPDWLPSSLTDFLRECLHPDLALRGTASDLLQHPWLITANHEEASVAPPDAVGTGGSKGIWSFTTQSTQSSTEVTQSTNLTSEEATEPTEQSLSYPADEQPVPFGDCTSEDVHGSSHRLPWDRPVSPDGEGCAVIQG